VEPEPSRVNVLLFPVAGIEIPFEARLAAVALVRGFLVVGRRDFAVDRGCADFDLPAAFVIERVCGLLAHVMSLVRTISNVADLCAMNRNGGCRRLGSLSS